MDQIRLINQLRLVVLFPMIYRDFYTSQVVSPISSINSMGYKL